MKVVLVVEHWIGSWLCCPAFVGNTSWLSFEFESVTRHEAPKHFFIFYCNFDFQSLYYCWFENCIGIIVQFTFTGIFSKQVFLKKTKQYPYQRLTPVYTCLAYDHTTCRIFIIQLRIIWTIWRCNPELTLIKNKLRLEHYLWP